MKLETLDDAQLVHEYRSAHEHLENVQRASWITRVFRGAQLKQRQWKAFTSLYFIVRELDERKIYVPVMGN